MSGYYGMAAFGDDGLHHADGVARVPVTLEQITLPSPLEMRPQFLREARQDRDVATGLSFGVREMDLGGLALEVDILDPEMDELIHACACVEERFDHQAIL